MKYTNDIHSANIVKPKKTISRKFSIQKITYCECGIISENYGNIKDFFIYYYRAYHFVTFELHSKILILNFELRWHV